MYKLVSKKFQNNVKKLLTQILKFDILVMHWEVNDMIFEN